MEYVFDVTKFDDVKVIQPDDLKGVKKLGEDEFLLKVRGDTGFMAKMTQAGKIPRSFEGWGGTYDYRTKVSTEPTWYIIKEKYRRDWEFVRLRHGMSTAWVVLRHPYGFTVEINSSAFDAIAGKITMVNGFMITPCYYQARIKNAELLVKKDDGHDFFYSLVKSVASDNELLERIQEIITDEHPDKVFNVMTGRTG